MVQVDPEFTKAVFDQELMKDWCTSTYTHHVGTYGVADISSGHPG